MLKSAHIIIIIIITSTASAEEREYLLEMIPAFWLALKHEKKKSLNLFRRKIVSLSWQQQKALGTLLIVPDVCGGREQGRLSK